MAVDGAGTVYVADTNNSAIRQVTAAGVVTTLAGLPGAVGGADGTGTNARFNNPEGVAADGGGTVYVADTVSDTIRKITPGGVVTTLAGFYGSLGSADGTGSAARFAYPFGVAIDTSRNVYVADRSNNTIRKITPAGVVTTFAGSPSSPGSADGAGSAARFSLPRAVAVDSAGTVYVADTGNHTIRTITPGGVVTTLAGLAGSSGNLDGAGSAARFNVPSGIAVDSTGTVYVADANNHTIRQIAPGGIVTTVAGLAGSSGNTNGTGSAARFNFPRGVAVNAAGTVYVADSNNNTIRQITPAGVVTTLAGMAGTFGGGADGTGSAARFNTPQGIAVDGAGTLYVADTNNQTIRKVTPGGVVTTVAGCTGCAGNEFYAQFGFFNQPQSVAVSAQGFLYVADSRNNTIRTTAPMPSSLAVDFGAGLGIWILRGATWSQLHPLSPEGFLTFRENAQHEGLVIDFGPGVGVWVWLSDNGNNFWFQIHSLSPTAMVGIDLEGEGDDDSGVFVFPGQGLWLYDGDNDVWTQLHGLDPSFVAVADLDGNPGQELIVNFPGYGLWVRGSSGWSQLHSLDVTSMLTTDLDGNGVDDVIVNVPGFGVWAYLNGATWSNVHALAAKRLAAGDLNGNGKPDLVIDFGTSVGVWIRRDDATWMPLHTLTTEGIAVGDLDGNAHDEVIIDFGAPGLWSYEDIGGWQQLHGSNPRGIATGRFK